MTHFTRNVSKPLVLGCCLVLLSISFFLFALPNILSDPYEPYGAEEEVDSRVCDPERDDPCNAGDPGNSDHASYAMTPFL